MRNLDWVSLTDAERGQLVAMWLLAADHNGVIPASPESIQKLCFMNDPPDINKFTDLGFIEDGWRRCGVAVASQRRQHDQPKAETEKNRINIPSNGFDEFWESYPKKVGKGEARKAWQRIKQPRTLLPTILVAIGNQCRSEQWKRNNGQFIPHPATWLNQGRWEDETEIKKKEYVTLE